MIARIAILGILVIALIAGAALYYLQVYAYYDDVSGNVEYFIPFNIRRYMAISIF